MPDELGRAHLVCLRGCEHGAEHKCAYRALEDHTVAVAHTLDVRGQVETDGPVTDGVHGLGVEEVVRPRWREESGT